ncbi:MAG: low molecular weight protein-tyrosine-phosphatase [Gammaproteobacteria bacterium]
MQRPDISVLFVCMGNICRSPTAEGVFRKLHQELAPQLALHADSAGTHDYHVGESPDRRAVLAAHERNIDISAHRGRGVTCADFEDFDYIVAMDRVNLQWLRKHQPPTSHADVRLLLEYAENCPLDEVPDPYYGDAQGFSRVLDLAEQGGTGLLRHICRIHGIVLKRPER